MAEKLMRYYKYIEEKQGLEGKIRLAMETKIPSMKAALVEDSAKNVKLFMEAIWKITGEPAPFL
jgi:hypothetical protein